MNEIILTFSFLVSWRLASKHGFYSPSSVFCWASTMNAFMYYLISIKGIYIDLISGWWQVKKDLSTVHGKVLLYYFGLTCVGLLASATLGSFAGQKKKKGRRSIQKQKKYLAESIDEDLIAKNKIDTQDSKVNKNIDKVLMSIYTLAILYSILFLIGLHLSTIDFSKVLYYREYLALRNDPASVGIENSFALFLHKSLPALGAVINIIAVFYWRRKAWYHFLITLIISSYSLVFSISFNSRFAVLQLVFIAFALVMTRKGKSRINLQPLLWGILAFLLYSALLYQRMIKTLGLGHFGLAPFTDIILSGSFLNPDIFFFFAFNIFSGGFLLGDAFMSPPFSYPPMYKLLTIFSPLPSAIDKFSKVEHFKTINKAAPTSPYNSFSEAYFFGAFYTVIFLLLLYFSLRLFNYVWHKFPGGYTFILLVPAYYCFLRMHTYPIRNTQRFLLFSIFMCLGLVFYANRKNKNRGKLKRNRPYEALGSPNID